MSDENTEQAHDAPTRFERVPSVRLIDRHELINKVSMSYQQIWALMVAGTFPRSRQCGERVLWVESEIDRWIESLPVKKLKGDPGALEASVCPLQAGLPVRRHIRKKKDCAVNTVETGK